MLDRVFLTRVARCKLAGTGQENPIPLISQPYNSIRIASEFVVLVLLIVLSETVLVLSETVLVLDGCLNCRDADG